MLGLADALSHVPKPAARWSRLFLLAALVGVLGGLAAAALDSALHHGTRLLILRFAPDFGGQEVLRFRWWVLLLPAIGGLVSGVAVRALCPDAFGHGTDALTHAFHRNLGAMPLKAPLVKGAAMAGVISCGGSAGPEGPIAALGAGIGSTIGRLFGLTPRERRVMLVAGCAAGIGAIFQCPLGGALFASSLLYTEEEFESDAIVPALVASVIGYSAFKTVLGGLGDYDYLLRGANQLGFHSVRELLPYAILGPLCGLGAMFFSVCFRFVEHTLVPLSRLPRWLAPAFGGLATGGLACLLPQVMDGRYNFIQSAMDGFKDMAATGWFWWAAVFAAVAMGKCVATALTVGSGASGGILGPSVFIGGAIGAALGALLEATLPDVFPPDSTLRQALIPVGMGGVLAASMRTPMAAIVMIMEMTGSYGLIVPLMLVCGSAYVVGRRWGLNHEQVRNQAESPAHAGDVIVHLLESCRVDQLMERDWPMQASPNATLGELVTCIQPGTRPVFAVIDREHIVGVISVPDIHRTLEEPGMAEMVIASDIMTARLATLRPGDDLYTALNEFTRGNHDVLPVVSANRKRRWLGMLARERVFDMVRKQIEDTQTLVFREHTPLAAIKREGQLQQLVMGVSPMRKDLIQRLLVPLQAIGKSLREADFRRQFGAQVIAVERPDGRIECPPNLDTPLQTDQRLLAIVWSRDPPGSDAAAIE